MHFVQKSTEAKALNGFLRKVLFFCDTLHFPRSDATIGKKCKRLHQKGRHAMKQIQETVKKVYGCWPETVLQFGEGNFLRAFADWMIDEGNRRGNYHGSICIVEPRGTGSGRMRRILNNQNGLYTLISRGIRGGAAVTEKQVITSVSRVLNPIEDWQEVLRVAESPKLRLILSNTTEAGIVWQEEQNPGENPPVSWPGKLAALLSARFRRIGTEDASELLILPCELIEDNGQKLEEYVLRHAQAWGYGADFAAWMKQKVHFADTLVDRIVSGYPAEEEDELWAKLGYTDRAMVAAEPFHSFVICGDPAWKKDFPAEENDASVVWTDRLLPYRMRKVRILNGGHTSVVPAAYLAGLETVGDVMKDPVFSGFLRNLLKEEVIPALPEGKKEAEEFADQVLERFSNPFVQHHLADILMNTTAKFPVRVLPSLMDSDAAAGRYPKRLIFAFAAYLRYEKTEAGEMIGHREDGSAYTLRDNAEMLKYFSDAWSRPSLQETVSCLLRQKELWNGADLTVKRPGLEQELTEALAAIEKKGIRSAMAELEAQA